MWDVILEKVIDSTIRAVTNIAVQRTVDYVDKKISSDDKDEDIELDLDKLFIDSIKIINDNNRILNNTDKEYIVEFIIEKFLENDSDLDEDVIEDIVKSIVFGIKIDIKIRKYLMTEFKKRPRLIKEKTSAITKTMFVLQNMVFNDYIMKNKKYISNTY